MNPTQYLRSIRTNATPPAEDRQALRQGGIFGHEFVVVYTGGLGRQVKAMVNTREDALNYAAEANEGKAYQRTREGWVEVIR